MTGHYFYYTLHSYHICFQVTTQLPHHHCFKFTFTVCPIRSNKINDISIPEKKKFDQQQKKPDTSKGYLRIAQRVTSKIPQESPNELRVRILGNLETKRKLPNWLGTQAVKTYAKSDIKVFRTFPILLDFLPFCHQLQIYTLRYLKLIFVLLLCVW